MTSKEPTILGTKHEPPRGFGDIIFAAASEQRNAPGVNAGVEQGMVAVDQVLKQKVHEQLDDDLVNSLAESFKVSGAGPINPIIVRRVCEKEDGKEVVKIVLVAGAHRLEAAIRAGLKVIACKFFEGDETEARIVQIEEDLFRKELTVLQRAELLAEWAELRLTKGYKTGHVVPKSTPGRPQGALSRFLQEMPALGRSYEARRKIIQRAMKIAGIAPAAKKVAITCGLDDNQKALLKIAKASGRAAQIKKAKDLVKRLKKALENGKPKAVSAAIATNKPSSLIEGDDDSPSLQPGHSDSGETSDSSNDDEPALPVPDDTTFEDLEATWDAAGGPKLWKYAPYTVRKEFTDKLDRARCAAQVDVVGFIRDVFRGREKIKAKVLYAYAQTQGFSRKVLRKALYARLYRLEKPAPGPGVAWMYRNNDENWMGQQKVVSDADLKAPAEADRVREDDAISIVAATRPAGGATHYYYEDL